MAYYLEFYNNIQSAQIVISTTNKNNFNISKLIFSPNEISIVLNSTKLSDQVSSLCKWSNNQSIPCLLPKSITNLKHIPNEGIHARLKTRPPISSSSWQQDIRGIFSEVLLDNPLINVGGVSVYCELCQERLLTYCFKSCLPLPSSDWLDIIGDVYCHAHQDEGTFLGLVPQNKDTLLIGEDKILMYLSVLIDTPSNSCVLLEENELKCSRCTLLIGHIITNNNNDKATVNDKTITGGYSPGCLNNCSKTNQAIAIATFERHKVYLKYTISNDDTTSTTNITIITTYPSTKCISINENWFAAKLYRLSEDLNCFHFVVTTKTGTQPIIQIKCFRNITWIITGRHIDNKESSTCPKLVLKLTYELLPSQETSHTTNTLSSTGLFHIETLSLHVESCYKLMDYLIRNNLSLPPSLRIMKGNLKVSYLELPSN